MLEHIQTIVKNIHFWDIAVIATNIFLFVFAGLILNLIQGRKLDSHRRPRLLTLRALSFFLLILYVLSLIPGITFGVKDCNNDSCATEIIKLLTESGVTLIVSYVLMFLAHLLIIKRFGRVKEVQGETIHYETYQSRLVTIVILAVVTSFLLLTLLSIWSLESWLRQTTVLGGLVVIIYFTKDLWLPDNINGLILLYKTDVIPGSLVRVKKLDLLGVTLRTSLIETAFRDLVHGQRIVIPNAMFRNQVIEILNREDKTSFKDYVEFNIGYGTEVKVIKSFLQSTWESACELESGINADYEPRFNVINTGDHAVTWRLSYSLQNPYRIKKAQMAISEAALVSSDEFSIGLNTPITHRILEP